MSDMIKNGISLDLSRVLTELDGKPMTYLEAGDPKDAEPRPLTIRRYLQFAFDRVRQIENPATFYTLVSSIIQHKNGTYPLDNANLKMVRDIVEKDALRIMDMSTGKNIEQLVSPVTRGQVLAILDGKA